MHLKKTNFQKQIHEFETFKQRYNKQVCLYTLNWSEFPVRWRFIAKVKPSSTFWSDDPWLGPKSRYPSSTNDVKWINTLKIWYTQITRRVPLHCVIPCYPICYITQKLHYIVKTCEVLAGDDRWQHCHSAGRWHWLIISSWPDLNITELQMHQLTDNSGGKKVLVEPHNVRQAFQMHGAFWH